MSHEIRTPMNAIIDFKCATKIRTTNKKNVLTPLKPLEFFNVIINDILDLAKVNAGKMNFEENPLNLNQTICEIFTYLS
jgi:signal transduction histidine kinase